jgi:Uma2 family endonuclease
LSPSTADYDRGEKFAAYRRIAELQEYAIVDASRLAVDLFRKDETGHWVLWPSEGQESVEFASIGFTASLAEIFEDVVPGTAATST